MVTNAYIVGGIMTDAQTIKLSEPLPVESVQVRVTVEVIRTIDLRPNAEVMEEIWAAQRARGHIPPTRAEVDAYITDKCARN